MLEAYTAGFLDADGYVAFCSPRKASMTWQAYLTVEFFNCDKKILEVIKDRWGGTMRGRKPAKPNHNASYILRVRYLKALNLLKDVEPFMLHGKKKARAKLIIDHYERCTPRNGKYGGSVKENREWLVNSVMQIQMTGAGAY